MDGEIGVPPSSKTMKISIVTATYNSAATLEDTLKSVLAQSHPDIEYLIMDGGSTDGTLDLVRRYAPLFEGRMRWISEPDKGIYDAMNKGFQQATGEVLMLINSDDFFAREDAVARVVEQFEAHPEADCVYADLYYVAHDDTSRIIRTWRSGQPRPFRKGWMPAHPTFYCRRSVYEKQGYFDLQFRLAADFDLMLRFVEVAKIKLLYLPEFLVRMRVGGATSSSLKNLIRQNRECVASFRKYGMRVGLGYLIRRFSWKIKQFITHS